MLSIGGLTSAIEGPEQIADMLAPEWLPFASTAVEATVQVIVHLYEPNLSSRPSDCSRRLLIPLETLWMSGLSQIPPTYHALAQERRREKLICAANLADSLPAFRSAIEYGLEVAPDTWVIGCGACHDFSIVDILGRRAWVFLPERIGRVVRALDGKLRHILALSLLFDSAIMLHAAGVLSNGEAYVFAGESGTGKTTITRLSTGRQMLSDEQVVVRITPEGCFAYSTPWVQLPLDDVRVRQVPCHQPVRIRALVEPVQSEDVWYRPLDAKCATAFALANCDLGHYLKKPSIAAQALSLCSGLASRVESYRMGFQLNASFWDALDPEVATCRRTGSPAGTDICWR